MKYFLDTEFHEYAKRGINTIELISIGIVAEDGRELYLVNTDFDLRAAYQNEWLRENVVEPIVHSVDDDFEDTDQKIKFLRDAGQFGYFQRQIQSIGFNRTHIKRKILEFIGNDKPEFYGYYCDYDWVVFCWLFGRMIDLPQNFPMFCFDLKQMLEEKAAFMEQPSEMLKMDWKYPKQENEHNALDDAKWNKSLYEFLEKIN